MTQPDRILWNDSFSLGIPEIDNEHRRLVNMINELSRAIDLGKGEAVLGAILSRLEQYVQTHFKHEEAIMRDLGFADLERHKRLHAELAQTVTAYRQRFQSGEWVNPIHLLNFLGDWLVNHIQKEDMKIVLEDTDS